MHPPRELLALEDDGGRLHRFAQCCKSQGLTLVHWRSAYEFVREVGEHLGHARLITLDHDLIPPVGEPSEAWGDGVVAAKHLAIHSACCPVVVHTSNSEAAPKMIETLRSAGWMTHRVAPIGSDWIESDWAPLVEQLAG